MRRVENQAVEFVHATRGRPRSSCRWRAVNLNESSGSNLMRPLQGLIGNVVKRAYVPEKREPVFRQRTYAKRQHSLQRRLAAGRGFRELDLGHRDQDLGAGLEI